MKSVEKISNLWSSCIAPDNLSKNRKQQRCFDALEMRQVDSIRNDFPDSANRLVQLRKVNELVQSVNVIIAAGQIHRHNQRNVRKRADSGLKLIDGNVFLEIRISQS